MVIASGLSHPGAILRPNAGTNFHPVITAPASLLLLFLFTQSNPMLESCDLPVGATLVLAMAARLPLMWHRGGGQPHHRGDEQCKSRSALMGFGRLSLSFSSSPVHTHLQVFACVQSFSWFCSSRLRLHTPSFPPPFHRFLGQNAVIPFGCFSPGCSRCSRALCFCCFIPF